jgi:cellulase/cellobiase CelA1
VTVTNGPTAVTSWALTFAYTAGQRVTQAWSADVTQAGTQVTARNTSYNGALAPGATVSFGFNGTSTGSNPRPAAFALNGNACTLV